MYLDLSAPPPHSWSSLFDLSGHQWSCSLKQASDLRSITPLPTFKYRRPCSHRPALSSSHAVVFMFIFCVKLLHSLHYEFTYNLMPYINKIAIVRGGRGTQRNPAQTQGDMVILYNSTRPCWSGVVGFLSLLDVACWMVKSTNSPSKSEWNVILSLWLALINRYGLLTKLGSLCC